MDSPLPRKSSPHAPHWPGVRAIRDVASVLPRAESGRRSPHPRLARGSPSTTPASKRARASPQLSRDPWPIKGNGDATLGAPGSPSTHAGGPPAGPREPQLSPDPWPIKGNGEATPDGQTPACPGARTRSVQENRSAQAGAQTAPLIERETPPGPRTRPTDNIRRAWGHDPLGLLEATPRSTAGPLPLDRSTAGPLPLDLWTAGPGRGVVLVLPARWYSTRRWTGSGGNPLATHMARELTATVKGQPRSRRHPRQRRRASTAFYRRSPPPDGRSPRTTQRSPSAHHTAASS